MKKDKGTTVDFLPDLYKHHFTILDRYKNDAILMMEKNANSPGFKCAVNYACRVVKICRYYGRVTLAEALERQIILIKAKIKGGLL